jgi:hypothetical protein
VNRIIIALALLYALPVRGDDSAPWSAGVPQAAQDKANALFAEGNQLFGQQAHAPALEKYRAAIAIWDHPMIRFNMAVTLIRLERILEAADSLEAALRYGNQPFTPQLYQQALDYQALIKRQVGTITASCTQPGTQVLLDGKPWFQCPGEKRERVLAGEHVVVGERKDFMTRSKRVQVSGGATATDKIELVPIALGMTAHYPYPRWAPFTMIGAGVAIGLGGVAFWFAGRSQMDQFVADFTQQCPGGCEANLTMHKQLADEQTNAKLKAKVGVGMMIGGGAVAVVGGVWTVITYRGKTLVPIDVAPAPGGGVVSYSGRF